MKSLLALSHPREKKQGGLPKEKKNIPPSLRDQTTQMI